MIYILVSTYEIGGFGFRWQEVHGELAVCDILFISRFCVLDFVVIHWRCGQVGNLAYHVIDQGWSHLT